MATPGSRRTAFVALLLLAAAPSSPGRAAPADEAGVATAVNTTARGLPPGGNESALDVGASIVQRERIDTDAAGQVQLLMLDGSSFTIGPAASIVLDEFYYDPAQGTGHAAVTLAKGLMRFIGGKLSKSQAVTIDTPNGTIGIRGGIAIVEVDEAAAKTRAIFLYGSEMTVTGKRGGVERVTRPGYAISVQRNARPAKPAQVLPAQLTKIAKTLSSPVARPVPSEVKLAKHEAAPLPVKPVSRSVKPPALHPPPQPIHPHLPVQARPRPPAKRAEGPVLADPCDDARQVCG